MALNTCTVKRIISSASLAVCCRALFTFFLKASPRKLHVRDNQVHGEHCPALPLPPPSPPPPLPLPVLVIFLSLYSFRINSVAWPEGWVAVEDHGGIFGAEVIGWEGIGLPAKTPLWIGEVLHVCACVSVHVSVCT